MKQVEGAMQNPAQGELRSLADVSNLLRALLSAHHTAERKEQTFLHPYHPGRYPFHIWFRAEPDAPDTQLLPSVLRQTPEDRFRDETSMFSYTRSRYPQFRGPPDDILGALCKMQHYHVPTRLLDWTESLGAALYFAVRERTERDSWLFCLNARKLNHVTGMEPSMRNLHDEWSYGTRFRCAFVLTQSPKPWYQRIAEYTKFRWEEVVSRVPQYPSYQDTGVPMAALPFHCTPVAVIPTTDDHRALQQRSVFTLHGGKQYDNRREGNGELIPKPTPMLDLQTAKDDQFLIALRVPHEAKDKLKYELQAVGFHEGTLFWNADTLGASIMEMF